MKNKNVAINLTTLKVCFLFEIYGIVCHAIKIHHHNFYGPVIRFASRKEAYDCPLNSY